MSLDEKIAEFRMLLEKAGEEQEYQRFLEENTRFIPHEFVQNHGIGMSLVLRKLGFGADYKSDFFYFSKSSDDWNAVLIEIERPSSKFFLNNTNKFHSDFQGTLHQIDTWRAWLSLPENQAAFLESLRAIQIPRHMARNPTYFKYVLVFGRRSEYEDNDQRKRLIISKESSDFKIITYDSLLENITRKYDLIVGSRKNQYIDLFCDENVDLDPGIFAWADPTQLRVSKRVQERLKSGPPSNHFRLVDGKSMEAFRFMADRIRVRPT